MDKEFELQYLWKQHVNLLDLVDMIEDQDKLRCKLKTKILDVAHEVQRELGQNKEE